LDRAAQVTGPLEKGLVYRSQLKNGCHLMLTLRVSARSRQRIDCTPSILAPVRGRHQRGADVRPVNFGERMPRPNAVTFAKAIHKARHDAGSWISAAECLVRIAQHFVDVWGPRLNKRFPRQPH